MADRDVISMSSETDIDPLRMPELIECRIKIQVHAPRHAFQDRFVGQHAGDVNQQIGSASRPTHLVIRQTDSLARTFDKQSCRTAEREFVGYLSKILGIVTAFERSADWSKRSWRDRLDKRYCSPSTYCKTAQVAPP
jgi:hypothetical protein